MDRLGIRGAAWFLWLGLAALAAACSHSSPSSPPRPRETVLLTESDDARAGEEAVREVVAQMGLVPDPALQEYVNELGRKLVRHAPLRSFSYRFQVVDQWSPNAFALPGGAIFVSRGLLVLANSEDELANVLAHEITHAAERHAAGRQAWVRQLSPFSLGLLRIADIAAYARDQERAADRGGQRMAAAAGYDPGAMSDFLESLEKVELLQMGAARIPTFLDTHPGTGERVASTAARAQQLSWQAPEAVSRRRETYLRRLEGLVLGDNPAEGVFRGSRFLHPDLDFAVNFPEGWELENSPSAVVALAPERDARFALEFAGRGDDPRIPAGAFLARRARSLGAQIEHAQSLNTGCCAAYQVRGRVYTAQGTLAGQLTWIAYGGNVYRLSATASSYVAEKYFGRARAMARSFRALTPEERAHVEVERLHVARARAGETIRDLLDRIRSSWDVQRIAVGNDLASNARLGEGQLLKVAIREPYAPAAAGAAPRP